MHRKTNGAQQALACAVSVGLFVAVAGCGGSTPSQPQIAPETVSSTPASGAAKTTKGKGGRLAAGGELSRQERKALKEQNATGK